MLDQDSLNVIEQLTLRKLVYAREFLRSASLPFSGTRAQVRQRLIDSLDSKRIGVTGLKTLLDELDLWGDQKIRLSRIERGVLRDFSSRQAVEQKIAETGFSELLNGEIALEPPSDLTPMRISYEETQNGRYLRLIAAKTQRVFVPQTDVPDYRDEEHYPGIIFKPFKEETQKAVDFAEINLDTGLALVSTTLFRHGISYRAEFNAFYSVFDPLIELRTAEPIELFRATHNIRFQLQAHEVRIPARRARTRSGGSIDYRSHSARMDIRTDSEIGLSEAALPSATSFFCNCYWEICDGLGECVHTFVYAPQGEVSIMGQVREVSARYVLRRILEIN